MTWRDATRRPTEEGGPHGRVIIRVETDAQGSPYEAHMTKADGTKVTVKVDKDFEVTDIQEGFGQHDQSA